MTFDIPPEIDKEFILERVSEEEIFSRYGVPIVNYPFQSPLRRDRYPTCTFFRSPRNNKLYMRDWAGHFWGDCFDLVCEMYNLRFYDALRMIAKDFGLIKGTGIVVERKPIKSNVIIEVKEVVKLAYTSREWNGQDAKYWPQFGIRKKTLQFFDVYPLQYAWLNDKFHYGYTEPQNTAYVYDFGNGVYKFYFPYRRKLRFLHNDASILQGFKKLPSTGEVLVITKSYKDVMLLYQYGIAAVAPMSETMVLSEDTINTLRKRFTYVVALYDHDETGIRSLKQYRDLGVLALWFPRSQPKDLTDFYKKYGEEDTNLLIETVRNNIL